MKEYPWGKGTPKWVRDATANNSDKSFTVPDGKMWMMQSIRAELICTATVGTRILNCAFTDGTNTVCNTYFTSPAASQVGAFDVATNYTAIGTQALRKLDNTAGVNVAFEYPIPTMMILRSGYGIRVKDLAAIDPAADDLTVILHYVEYDA